MSQSIVVSDTLLRALGCDPNDDCQEEVIDILEGIAQEDQEDYVTNTRRGV